MVSSCYNLVILVQSHDGTKINEESLSVILFWTLDTKKASGWRVRCYNPFHGNHETGLYKKYSSTETLYMFLFYQ